MSSARAVAPSPWQLVLCLVGLDYFSTLAYFPSLAVRAGGVVAPLATMVVVAVTLFVALPVYLYLVGKSPHGRGGIGVLEHALPGWSGKFLILCLLAFVATDFVVTRNLSVADAAEHLRSNPYFHKLAERLAHAVGPGAKPGDDSLGQRFAAVCRGQLTLTLALSLLTFAFWSFWNRGSRASFFRLALVVVCGYILLVLIVVGSGCVYLAGPGRPLVDRWIANVTAAAEPAIVFSSGGLFRLAVLALAVVPHLCLGLSGFELSMAVVPLIKGTETDAPHEPRQRIRNARKLLVSAALVMAILAPGTVFVVTLLVAPGEHLSGGAAVHRALAYLAHGSPLADGVPATAINSLFGPRFGTLFDLGTAAILCLAGASVSIGLCDFVPAYLTRYGMELEWARRIGIEMRFFNLIMLLITIVFVANVDALQWVYATSVLVLMSGAALAAVVAASREPRAALLHGLGKWLFIVAFLVLTSLTTMTVLISRAGLEIAGGFVVAILATSVLSRWLRSLELRFHGFEFADPQSQESWRLLCERGAAVLVPHRPGLNPRVEKERGIRTGHRLPPEIGVIFIEAELGDPSDFYQRPLLTLFDSDGLQIIQVTRCVSIAHVIAAIGLELSRSATPPEIHFGWSDETPLAANLKFLLFGQGNVPWMVRALLRKAERNPDRQPRIVVG